MALDHPWLGVGPDNFLYAYRTRYVLPSAWQELSLSHPHNIVLDLWTRLGIPGLAVGIWAIASGAWRAWRLFNHPDPWIWPIALGLLGGLAATVAHGLIDNSLFLVDLMAIFMLSLGLLQRLATEPSG
jgi:putative inorganic carbon (HCO3(-)) transporter